MDGPTVSAIATVELYRYPNREILPFPSLPTRSEESLPLKKPDDRYLAYLQVLAAFCISLVVNGWSNSTGLMQVHYTQTLAGRSQEDIAWITSLGTFFTYMPSIVLGGLCDAGHARLMVCIGTVLVCGGGIIISFFPQNYAILLAAQGIGMGLGRSMVWIPSTYNVSSYFSSRQQPLAIAFVQIGSTVGCLTFPVLFERAQPTIGFENTMRALALISGGLLSIATWLIHPKQPSSTGRRPIIDFRSFTKWIYLALLFVALTLRLGTFGALTYSNPYGTEVLGASEEDTLPFGLIRDGFGLPGNLLAAYIAFRISKIMSLNLLIFCTMTICLICWQQVHSLTGMMAWSGAFGFLNAAIGVVFLSTELQVSQSEKLFPYGQGIWGARLGMCMAFEGFGGLGGPQVFGRLIKDSGGGFESGQSFCALSVAVSCLALLVLMTTTSKWKDEKGVDKGEKS